MALYRMKGGQLELVKANPFKLEKEMQELTENNLETILGLQFVRSEFSLGKFKIDTLGFDNQTHSFVIIEYKKVKSFSVIDQGYTYLALMLNNKADFILEYNENSKGNLKKKDVDWSQSRVLFISPSFTTYQKEAINFKDLPIELWEMKKFSNETVLYNKVKAAEAKESVKTISKGGRAVEKVSKEIRTYTEEELLEGKASVIKDAVFTLKEEILSIDPDIEEKITKTMICYYSGGKGLVWINPKKRSLKVHLRKGRYKDKFRRINPEGWGGYPMVTSTEDQLEDIQHMKYLKDLLRQAYNK